MLRTVGPPAVRREHIAAATIVGDSAIYQSQPYTDDAMPKEVGQVTFRYAGLASMGTSGTGNLSVSPVSKPNTVIVRARVEATKR